MSTFDHTTSEVEYRDILDFPGYRVGNDGSVWSSRKRMSDGHRVWWILSNEWARLKPQPRQGYLRVGLYRDGKIHLRNVSHLVLEAFVGPQPPGMDACHDPDPSRSNNHVRNLRWDTRKANIGDYERWRKKNGIADHRKPRFGEESHFAKMNNAKVVEMRRLIEDGMPVPEAARLFGIDLSTAHKIRKRKIWRHV